MCVNFFINLNKLNQYYSFQLFSITGWLILILIAIFGTNYIQSVNKSYEVGFALLLVIPILLLLSFILAIVESIIGLKINNKFFLENKIIKIVRFLGALFAFLYSMFFVCMLLKMILLS